MNVCGAGLLDEGVVRAFASDVAVPTNPVTTVCGNNVIHRCVHERAAMSGSFLARVASSTSVRQVYERLTHNRIIDPRHPSESRARNLQLDLSGRTSSKQPRMKLPNEDISTTQIDTLGRYKSGMVNVNPFTTTPS